MMLASYPGQLIGIKDIKITKKQSGTPIPDYALRFCYSSIDNVKCIIDEITDSGITFTIIDTNEIPYEYKNEYYMSKKTENPKAYYIMETERKNGETHRWEDAQKITDSSNEIKEEILIKNKGTNNYIEKRKIDWTQVYGKLEEWRILHPF